MAVRRWAIGAPRSLALVPIVLVVGLVTGGCGPDPDLRVGSRWKLTSIDGLAPATGAALAFMAEGRFSIHTGCNSGGGTYRFERDRLVFTEIRLTKMACDGPIGAQEDAILGVLQAGPQIRALDNRGGGLELVAGDVTLSFVTPDAGAGQSRLDWPAVQCLCQRGSRMVARRPGDRRA